MTTLIIGAILLSIVHAMIPNHWMPLVILGKAEHWSRRETTFMTVIVGLAHTTSTVIIGILIGLAGVQLSEKFHHFSTHIAPTILVIIGLIYLTLGFWGSSHHHHHHGKIDTKKKSKLAIVSTLGLAMFLSPCMEIEAYYFTAAGFGWIGIMAVSVIYIIVTVSGMVLLAYLGMIGVDRLNWHFLDHNERIVTGGILTILGVIAFFVHF